MLTCCNYNNGKSNPIGALACNSCEMYHASRSLHQPLRLNLISLYDQSILIMYPLTMCIIMYRSSSDQGVNPPVPAPCSSFYLEILSKSTTS